MYHCTCIISKLTPWNWKKFRFWLLAWKSIWRYFFLIKEIWSLSKSETISSSILNFSFCIVFDFFQKISHQFFKIISPILMHKAQWSLSKNVTLEWHENSKWERWRLRNISKFNPIANRSQSFRNRVKNSAKCCVLLRQIARASVRSLDLCQFQNSVADSRYVRAWKLEIAILIDHWPESKTQGAAKFASSVELKQPKHMRGLENFKG